MRIVVSSLAACFFVLMLATEALPQTPQITNVSPTEAFVGTQVSITGTGFGNSQGSGVVWLGDARGIVVSWSDTQVIAAVASGSGSGRAQIQQNGVSSNPVDFIVDSATINDVSPTSAAPGMQVTITGIGFHDVQGSGQIWVGTAFGQVNSWSDTQIIATIAANSASGYISVIQDGLWSNFVDFTVLGPPHITQINPQSGAIGTSVTISGTGFGSTQSGGQVWIGGTSANVTQWSDTSIQATVANNAVSGVAKVQVSNAWSNNIAYRVTTGGAGSMPSLILVPDTVSMVAGDTRSLQALDSNSQPATGLSWTSSDTTIATLSTDDPPIVTAVAPGNVTIYAGQASADITVYPGPTLPVGTVQWSYAGDGSGCCWQVHPAVPSETGVADMFIQNGSSNVQAVRSDGTVAWTKPIDWHYSILPDFQGGFVAFSPMSLFRVDGLTGQAYPSYTASTNFDQDLGNPLKNVVIHTDGTIFTLDYACTLDDCGANDPTTNSWVIGIDPATGTTKFKAAAVNSNGSYSYTSATGMCGQGSAQWQSFPWLSYPIIAGDGFAYTSYITQDSRETSTDPALPQPFTSAEYALIGQLGIDILNPSAALADLNAMSQTLASIFSDVFYDEEGGNTQWAERDYQRKAGTLGPYCDGSDSGTEKLHLLRVSSDGSSTDMIVKQWSWQRTITHGRDPSNVASFTATQSYAPFVTHEQGLEVINAITNADTGVLFSWKTDEFNYCETLTDLGCTTQFKKPAEYHLTTTNGTAVAQDATMIEVAPNQTDPIQPVLQLQDGSFVGTTNAGGNYAWTGQYMVKFDSSGNVAAVQSGYGPPQMATADGSVVTQDGTIFDSSLNISSNVWSLPTQSWRGNSYQLGSIERVAQPSLVAASLWSWVGGNPSSNGSAGRPWYFKLVWQNDFSFTPASGTYEVTGALQPSAIAIVKSAALKELQDAYTTKPLTVIASEGLATTGDDRATVVNHQTLVPNSPECGATNQNDLGSDFRVHDSQVDYISNMKQGQLAYNVAINSAQDEADAMARTDLLQAIGRGIGASAAHEIAHHFLKQCCQMDADPQTDLNARGTINATGCYAPDDPSPWTGYWPNPIIGLHWENAGANPTTQDGLTQCLGRGWRDFGGSSCHQ